MLDEAGRYLRTRTRVQLLALAAAALAGAVLVGSAAFGLIHIVGGAIRGNPRAVWFGVWLSLASSAMLTAGAVGGRRLARARSGGRE